jgi:G:T-mismatch repair DNA endonuclease (very short patch repair protein)
MPDVFTKAKRSHVMGQIRSSGNKDTELKLITLFRKHGIRGWRRKQALFGKPISIWCKATPDFDFVMPWCLQTRQIVMPRRGNA